MSNIFHKRETIKPYEYPQLLQFVDAIDNSFWTHRKFDFTVDIQDFHTDLTEVEKEVIKRAILCVSHVENSVKSFFGRLDMRLPKPEVSFVGAKFSANEVTHSISYAHLLDLLGLNDEFSKLMEVPAMMDRTEYLKKYLSGISSRSDKEFTKSLILFTLLVENISLFAVFLIISSFKKYKQKIKTVAKVIASTGREENLHALFGSTLIKIIKQENPEWFDEEMEQKIRRNIRKSIEAENKVLDWIFEKGELDFLSKDEVKEYLKSRANNSLELVDYSPEYELDKSLLKKSNFMGPMLEASNDFDFFDQRAGDYDKNKPFNIDNIFG